MAFRRSMAGLVVAALCVGSAFVPPTGGTVVHAGSDAARFVPHEPLRVLDSRTGVGMPAHKLVAQESVTLRFDESTGVPADATAVALNVTVTESAGPGFISAWPTGTPRPTVSSVNVTSANQTIANFAIVPLGANRSIDLFTYAGAHLVIDYSGFWVPSGDSSDGRYVSLTPVRVIDTRDPGAVRPAAGSTTDVQITGVGGVPANATAAVIGVTVVDADQPAFITAWGAGAARPLASTLNVASRNAVANMALVPIGSGGRISLFAQNSAHLIVDLQGYITGSGAAISSSGLFVTVPPTRVVDSREDLGLARMGAYFDQEVPLAGAGGVPTTGVSAVAANFTATQPRSAGFLTVYPGRTPRPFVSTLNFAADDTVAAFGLPKVGLNNSLGLVTMKQVDVIVDVSGYFLGDPVAAVRPPPIKCSDLMIYDYAPEGIANADDYELRVRDLSGNNPDRSLLDGSIFFRIAPGCQYVIVARESVQYPGSLALYRYDSVLQPTVPTLISDDLPWRGASITDNAEWIYLYAGWIDVESIRQDAVIAVNAWTGEERLAMATPDLDYVVGTTPLLSTTRQHNRPAVLIAAPSSPQQLRIAGCRFMVYFLYGVPIEPCYVYDDLQSVDVYEADVQGGRAAAYVDRSGRGWVHVWRYGSSYARITSSGTSYPLNADSYHPRLTWDLSPVFSEGSTVRMYKGFPPSPTGSLPPAPTGTILLDTTYSDFPEFSRPLIRTVMDPPDITSECAFTIPGCFP